MKCRIQIEISKKRKKIAIKLLESDQLCLSFPPFYTMQRAQEWMAQNQDWIDKASTHLMKKHNQHTLPQNKILFLGQWIECVVDHSLKHQYTFTHQKLILQEPEALKLFYRQEAQHYLPIKVEEISSVMGVKPHRITIRTQKSRWGSCSSRGTISLSDHLMKMPQNVGDYIIIHELAHLKHLHHQASFWEFVALYAPDFRDAIRWLKKHQSMMTVDFSKTLSTVT